MENLESRLKNAPYFRCEKETDSIPLCQKCETCVLAWKIFSTKEWFCRINDLSQRRFLVGILKQLNSLYLLHYFQNILQTTQGKDFIYNRSRIDLSKKEGKVVKSSLNQMLDKTVEQKMKEILYWFANSTQWTKANYTLLLLQMCNPKLLLTAANVIRVLFLREENSMSGLNQDTTDVWFSPEKDHSSQSTTSQVYWTAKTQHTSLPLSKAPENEHLLGAASNPEEPWRNSLRCVSEMNRLFSGKGDITKPGYDPCNLLVNLDDIRDLSSGFSKYRDFIRYLPIHLSKYILRMLDRHTLNKCASVSQHWAAMAQQVKMDLSAHGFIQNQITFLQGSYTRGIDSNYANKVSIPVPKMVDDGKRMRVKHPQWKLRTKNEYNLWTAYQNQETQQVLMEERNVFCGTYNVRILSDMWDQNRVIHYSGGDLIAVSSNQKIHLLDIIQVKAIPVEFRGHAGSVRALFLCEEANFLLSGSYDLSIRYWDLKSGACIRIFGGHQGTITCMDLYKNRLVSGGRDCQVKVWDVDTGKCLKTFRHKDPILATRINDTYIVSSCERGVVKVWHIAMAQLVKTLNGHEGAVKCLFFDQWHLLSGSTDGLVMAWSMVGKYERCLMAFKHPKEVLHVSLLFLRVISACADGKIRIYNFLNGNCMKVIKADGRGDPVLSFFIQGNRMVVNTESNVLMFQFEHIKWQYAVEKAKQKKNKEKEEEKEENSLMEILSKSNIQVHSPRESVSSKQTVIQELLPGKPPKSRVLLKPAKFSSADIVEKAQKQGQLETPGKLPSHPKKKSWKIPMSPDQFLLTVSTLQQAHNSGEFAYPCRPQTEITDVWGPSISYPRKVLNFKGKSIQRAVDQLRLSNPPIDVKQTSIPLEIQKLQPNLKISLHSPRVQSTIPQPMIIRPRFSGSFKGGDQVTSSIERAVCSTGPLTSMQVIKPNCMLAPQVGTATLSLKKERPRIYTALDPLRVNTEFVLLTVKEEKEHQEAKMKEYQARESTGVVNTGKASKAAWIRKIKGLPIDNFMKQGRTAAPELGQNVFI
ncbi:F-box and WD repeat domain containing protein 10B isoform X1 [Hylobates moloch]|uniref:F-box and WD repeat domain containing protein 10B isoform X1 n=2 Tax=Hylobates moloch TaxID=81572 RepID=UPI00136204F9|nr:F-box and WD repeat domain containing protein 10B isoform X1 [Hylobates moloch]